MTSTVTKSAHDLIKQILAAKHIGQVVDLANFDDDFGSTAKLIHPDLCHEPNAGEAMAALLKMRDHYNNGTTYVDETGEFKASDYWVEFTSSEPMLNWSAENWERFIGLTDKASKHFAQYIPSISKHVENESLSFTFENRSIPLSKLTLPQEHVNWVLNRLLEYCGYLSQLGWSHCGLNPESVFITPENHGIQICSFYHLTKVGNKVGTISAKYASWYPHDLFVNKIADASIDVELSKMIARTLLGGRSAVPAFENFLHTHHKDGPSAMYAYKEMLRNNFKSEFHTLNI